MDACRSGALFLLSDAKPDIQRPLDKRTLGVGSSYRYGCNFTFGGKTMGHTLTLDVPEEVYQSLMQQAEQTGQPPEAVAVQLLATATQRRIDDPLEPFIGALSSQSIAWAEQHDAYLGKAVKNSMDHTPSKEHPDA